MGFIGENLEFIVIILAYIIMFAALLLTLHKNTKADDTIRQLGSTVSNLNDAVDKMSSNYSETVLNYIKSFTTQITVLYYNEFIDAHDPEKVSKTQLQTLINEICDKVHSFIVFDNIMFDKALFTRETIYDYIIRIVMSNVKSLFSKTLGNS